MWPLPSPKRGGCSEPLNATAQMVIITHRPWQSFLRVPLLNPWGPTLDLINTKGEKAKWMFSQPPFSPGQLEVIKARGCSLVHKPVRVFGVMILLFNCLCFSLGQLIPQCDWWKPQYWFLCLSKPQLCSTLVRHLKEYPVGSGGNLRARLNRLLLREVSVRLLGKPVEWIFKWEGEREEKGRGRRGWETREREGRKGKRYKGKRESRERKTRKGKEGGKEREKELSSAKRDLEGFPSSAPFVFCLPLLIKGDFFFYFPDQHYLEWEEGVPKCGWCTGWGAPVWVCDLRGLCRALWWLQHPQPLSRFHLCFLAKVGAWGSSCRIRLKL